MNDAFRDALAARAAGEEFPGAAEVETLLASSAEAREDLAGLEAAVGVLRGAVPAPSDARRGRVLAAVERSGGGWSSRRWALAAALLLSAGVAIVGGLSRRSARAPLGDPADRPVAADPGASRLRLADLLADLAPMRPAGPLLGPGDVRPSDNSRMGGGEGGGSAERSWLAPVARQAGMRGVRPTMLPGNLALARAAVLRAAPGGPPADVFWQRYTGDAGEMVLIQAPRESAAWLSSVPLPAGWIRLVGERHGAAVLLASPSADEAALRKVLETLALLPE